MRTSESDQPFLKLVVKNVMIKNILTSVSDMNGSLEYAEKILAPGLVSNLYNFSDRGNPFFLSMYFRNP